MAFAHTEKGARYNLAQVDAQAKKAGSGWEINGEKFVVLGAPAADTFVVSAKTDKGLFFVSGKQRICDSEGVPSPSMSNVRAM